MKWSVEQICVWMNDNNYRLIDCYSMPIVYGYNTQDDFLQDLNRIIDEILGTDSEAWQGTHIHACLEGLEGMPVDNLTVKQILYALAYKVDLSRYIFWGTTSGGILRLYNEIKKKQIKIRFISILMGALDSSIIDSLIHEYDKYIIDTHFLLGIVVGTNAVSSEKISQLNFSNLLIPLMVPYEEPMSIKDGKKRSFF